MEAIKTGYDPKNRSVHVVELKKGKTKKFQVVKPETGFKSPELTKAEADKAFDFQVSCSQN